MTRYIDVEKLKCSVDSETYNIFYWGMTIEELYYNLCKLIDDEPTADVQPVAHAEWIGFTRSAFLCCDHTGEPIYRDTTVWKCSHCSRNTVVRDNYCPNCGARMDGDSK